MTIRLTYILLLLLAMSAKGQYYLRGEVKDEKNQPLQNARIFLHSVRQQYMSGTSGGFGIITRTLNDSITVSLDGYETQTVKINANTWQYVTMKVLPATVMRNRPKLISITKDLEQTSRSKWIQNDETYFQLVENEYVDAKKYPNTGFSLNVNKASYSNVRRFINTNSSVPPDAVRTEEMVNYFNLHYSEPDASSVFKISSQLTSCPWDEEKQLLLLNINARKLDLDKIPPGNFVFLIDASGSMDMQNRLPLLKAAFQMFVKNLRPIDTVSIVTYGGTVGIWMQPTGGAEKEKIIERIEELTASGDTPGEAAIMTAYSLARNTFNKKGTNRVILATDGDFNVGLTSEKALEELITKERQSGVYLTCLGVGMGNFKNSKLEALAKRGNGNFAYLDDIAEAEKVLVKELTQTFFAVADDVFMNIQFNPRLVRSYRLIGFDNKKDAVADSTIDLEGGEIGSGNSVVAMFEIIPAADLTTRLPDKDGLAGISMRYSLCNDTSRLYMQYTCPANYIDFKELEKELQFAAAVSLFGLKLKQSKYIKDVDWQEIETLTLNSYNPSSYLQNEFLQLVGKARKIYDTGKKKKKKAE